MTYTVEPQTYTVINLTTGERHQTKDLSEMMRLHSQLVLAAKGPARAGTKEQRRQERKEAGR